MMHLKKEYKTFKSAVRLLKGSEKVLNDFEVLNDLKQVQGKRRPGMLSCVAKVSDCSRLKI